MPMYCTRIIATALLLLVQPLAAQEATTATGKDTRAPVVGNAAIGAGSGTQAGSEAPVRRAVFDRVQASADVRHIADWVVDSADNKGLPFVIVDKINAKVFVFDSGGRIRGAAPALLGLARGDHTVPGIGDKPLSQIRPEERTTPAGRFVGEHGMSTRGVDVVWVDYDSGVSLHRVITADPRDRRHERLASPTAADNRISYGCINVPVAFYNNVVSPAFARNHGIFYVLPETRSVQQMFGSYDVNQRQANAPAPGALAPATIPAPR